LPQLDIGAATHDAQLWFDDPASQALREAALLGSPGYQDACAALLPYQHALGQSRTAARFPLDNQAADMTRVLSTPAESLHTHQRTPLYLRLFRSDLGLRHARLALGRLRDDIHRFPPTEATGISVAARAYAWTNITAYLDILTHLHSTGADL